MFREEKKFNLDVPDGFAYYGHDTGKDLRLFCKRQVGRKSVIVWCTRPQNEVWNVILITDKKNSIIYTEVLRDGLLEFAERTVGDTFIFQQGNAATHEIIYTTEWLDANVVFMID